MPFLTVTHRALTVDALVGYCVRIVATPPSSRHELYKHKQKVKIHG